MICSDCFNSTIGNEEDQQGRHGTDGTDAEPLKDSKVVSDDEFIVKKIKTIIMILSLINVIYLQSKCHCVHCLCSSTECTENRLALQRVQSQNQSFSAVLLRELTAMNINVDSKSVHHVSWEMVEDRNKDFVVKRLKKIVNLDETKCNDLYRTIDSMTPIVQEENLRDIKQGLYEEWILKCMLTLFLWNVMCLSVNTFSVIISEPVSESRRCWRRRTIYGYQGRIQCDV